MPFYVGQMFICKAVHKHDVIAVIKMSAHIHGAHFLWVLDPHNIQQSCNKIRMLDDT